MNWLRETNLKQTWVLWSLAFAMLFSKEIAGPKAFLMRFLMLLSLTV